jgi:hypothetical protein
MKRKSREQAKTARAPLNEAKNRSRRPSSPARNLLTKAQPHKAAKAPATGGRVAFSPSVLARRVFTLDEPKQKAGGRPPAFFV